MREWNRKYSISWNDNSLSYSLKSLSTSAMMLMKLAVTKHRFPNTRCHDPIRILIREGSWKFAIQWRSTVNLRGRIQGKNSKKRRRKGRSNTGLTVKGIIHPRHGYYFDVGRYFKRSTRERIDFHRDNFLPRRYKKLAVGEGNVP